MCIIISHRCHPYDYFILIASCQATIYFTWVKCGKCGSIPHQRTFGQPTAGTTCGMVIIWSVVSSWIFTVIVPGPVHTIITGLGPVAHVRLEITEHS